MSSIYIYEYTHRHTHTHTHTQTHIHTHIYIYVCVCDDVFPTHIFIVVSLSLPQQQPVCLCQPPSFVDRLTAQPLIGKEGFENQNHCQNNTITTPCQTTSLTWLCEWDGRLLELSQEIIHKSYSVIYYGRCDHILLYKPSSQSVIPVEYDLYASHIGGKPNRLDSNHICLYQGQIHFSQ